MWDTLLGSPESMFRWLFVFLFVGGAVAVVVWLIHAVFHAIVDLVGKARKAKFSWSGLLTAGLVMLALALLASFLQWALCEDHPGWRLPEPKPRQQVFVPIETAPMILPVPIPTTSQANPFQPQRNAVAFEITGEETAPLWIDGKCKWTIRDGPDHFRIYLPNSRFMDVSNSGNVRDLGHLGSKIGLKFPGPCTLIVEKL